MEAPLGVRRLRCALVFWSNVGVMADRLMLYKPRCNGKKNLKKIYGKTMLCRMKMINEKNRYVEGEGVNSPDRNYRLILDRLNRR